MWEARGGGCFAGTVVFAILSPMSAPATLLVVHSDPAVHKVVREALDAEHWHIDDATDSREAFARLESAQYDMILAGDGGVPVLRRMHEMQPGAKVVLSSAQTEPAQVIQFLRAGITCCVHEPLSPDSLRRSLGTVLDWHIDPDDIEILSDRPAWISLRLRAKIETAERVSHFFRQFLSDLSHETCDATITAFREVLINAVEHGAHLDPNQRVEVTYIRAVRCLMFYVRDPGEGFSLEDVPHAAISNPDAPLDHVELREQMGSRPGGFGILLTRNFVDELLYSAKGNEALLIRYL